MSKMLDRQLDFAPCTHFRSVLHRIERKESKVSESPRKDSSRALALTFQIGNFVVGLVRLLVELMSM
jgi:hypothetical protein